MVILCNILLIFVNLIHFYKHFKCRQRQDQNTEFGAYPLLFFAYSVLQLGLSIYLTLLYICDPDATYEYHEDNPNSSDLITLILFYPFGKKQDFTYFIKPNSINNYKIYNTSYTTIISIAMLFIIYFFEGLLHFYRYYTMHNTYKYLKNASFTTIIKYYIIYVVIILIAFSINLFFLQTYFLNLIVMFHCIFMIYCTNQQTKILYDSTKESFNKQHMKILMAPLFLTRIYSFLSLIPSVLFLFIFIISNTFNSLLYYPIFASLNTYLLSLIFARNRYLFCKCCKYKQKEAALTVITDNKSQVTVVTAKNKLETFTFLCCLQCTSNCKKTKTKDNVVNAQQAPSLSNSTKDSIFSTNDLIKSDIDINANKQENTPNSHVLLPTVANISLDDVKMSYVINKLNKLNKLNLPSQNMNMSVNNDIEGGHMHIEEDGDLFDYTHVLSRNKTQNDIENNMENYHVKHVTAVNMPQNAISPCLNSIDLAQNLTLLNILTSQGLMKNPIELLHCRQKPSTYALQQKKYTKQKQKHMEMMT